MGDCGPQSKKIGCEHFEEVWGKGGEEKKGFPVSHGDLHMEDIGGDEGAASEGMFQNPLEVAEICQMIPAPLFGARLAPGMKCILIRVTFLIPLQSTRQHPSPSNVSPNPQKVI